MFNAIRYRSTELALKDRMLEFIGTVILNRALPYCAAQYSYPMMLFGDGGAETPLQGHWLFYDWIPPNNLWRAKARKYSGGTVAEAFLAARSKSLNDEEKDVLRATIGTPASFYRVLARKEDRWMELEDLVLGLRVRVTDRDLSGTMQPKHIFYGRVVSFRATAVLAGIGRAWFSPEAEKPILDFRCDMTDASGPITMEHLLDQQDMLRGLYFRMKSLGTREEVPFPGPS